VERPANDCSLRKERKKQRRRVLQRKRNRKGKQRKGKVRSRLPKGSAHLRRKPFKKEKNDVNGSVYDKNREESPGEKKGEEGEGGYPTRGVGRTTTEKKKDEGDGKNYRQKGKSFHRKRPKKNQPTNNKMGE